MRFEEIEKEAMEIARNPVKGMTKGGFVIMGMLSYIKQLESRIQRLEGKK